MSPLPNIDMFIEVQETTGGELAGAMWDDTERGTWFADTMGSRLFSLTSGPPATEGWRRALGALERRLIATHVNLHLSPVYGTRSAFTQLLEGRHTSTGEQETLFRLNDAFYSALTKLSSYSLLTILRGLTTDEDSDSRFRRLEWLATATSDELLPTVIARQVEDGSIEAAYRLVALFIARNPTSTTARRWLRVLTPPTIDREPIPSTTEQATAIRDNVTWLSENAGNYAGEWVALLDGKLLGHAKRLRQLRSSIDIPPEALLTRLVP